MDRTKLGIRERTDKSNTSARRLTWLDVLQRSKVVDGARLFLADHDDFGVRFATVNQAQRTQNLNRVEVRREHESCVAVTCQH